MSRSVAEQHGAELVKYTHSDYVYGTYNPETDEYEGDEYDEFETQENFDCLVDNLKAALIEALPSFREVPERREDRNYDDRAIWHAADHECFPILQNGNCVVFLSSYMELVSISFVPRYNVVDGYYETEAIQRHWINQVESKINATIESVCERLICCGRFSNGEAVFSRVTRKSELTAIANGEAV